MKYKRAQVQPETVDIKLVDGIFVKSTTFRDAGMIVPQHAHAYAHLSGIASGAVRVEVNGVLLGEFVAPALIPIRARTKHLFITLVPLTTVWCIHNADRCEAGEIAIYEEHHLDMAEG